MTAERQTHSTVLIVTVLIAAVAMVTLAAPAAAQETSSNVSVDIVDYSPTTESLQGDYSINATVTDDSGSEKAAFVSVSFGDNSVNFSEVGTNEVAVNAPAGDNQDIQEVLTSADSDDINDDQLLINLGNGDEIEFGNTVQNTSVVGVSVNKVKNPDAGTHNLTVAFHETGSDIANKANQSFAADNDTYTTDPIDSAGSLTIQRQAAGSDGETDVVGVENVDANVNSTVFLTYENTTGDTIVAGLTNRTAGGLNKNTITVNVTDSSGFPGTHTAHLVPNDNISQDYAAGDAFSAATANETVANDTAVIHSASINITNQTTDGTAVEVANASLEPVPASNYSIAIYEAAGGDRLGYSEVLSNASVENVTVQLDTTLSEETDVFARLSLAAGPEDPDGQSLTQFDASGTTDTIDSETATVTVTAEEGPLAIRFDPGTAGQTNDFTYGFNATDIEDGSDLTTILVDFDNASNASVTEITQGDVSIDAAGSDIGVDGTKEAAPGVLELTLSDNFVLGQKDGNITINISAVTVSSAGDFDGETQFLIEDETVAFGTDNYTVEQADDGSDGGDNGGTDPAKLEVSNLTPANTTVTEGDDPIDISVAVENTGDETANKKITLNVSNNSQTAIIQNVSVDLDSGETSTETFTNVALGDLAPGSYNYSVITGSDSIEGNATVRKSSTDDPSSDPPTGPLKITTSPGSAGTANTVAYSFNASTVTTAADIDTILINFSSASGVDATKLSEDDVSIEGQDTGTPGVDATTERAPGVVELSMADTFDLANEAGQLNVTVSGVTIPNSGSFEGDVAFISTQEIIATGTDNYTIATATDIFELSELTLDNATVTEDNTSVTATVTVNNTGGASGAQTLAVRVINSSNITVYEDTRENVNIDASGSKSLRFKINQSLAAGSYTIEAVTNNDTANTTLSVEASDDDGEFVEEQPGFGVGVAVLALLVVRLIARRRN